MRPSVVTAPSARLLACLVSCLVAVSLLAAVPSASAGAVPRAAAPQQVSHRVSQQVSQQAARAATACSDVLLVGIDGNGERPARGATFGPTVSRAVTAYAAALGPRTLRRMRVPIATKTLSDMVARYDKRRRDTGDAPRAAALRRWQGPLGEHMSTAGRMIDQRAVVCPDEQLVLVGYAQGASVIHRMLDRYARAGRLGRIAGALLISDPDRRYNTRSHLTGGPSAPRTSSGIIVHRFSPPPADVPRATATFGAYTVCTVRDLVCDPSTIGMRRAFQVARSYASSTGGGAAIGREVAQLATRTRLLPVPAPLNQVAVGSAGEPLAYQLTVDVAPAARSGVQWTATGAVPGLSLTPSGLLTGTPPSSGTFTLPYTVRGTSPATASRSGSVTITVAAGAVGISAAGQSTCQTKADGSAYCWGRNDYGQVGDGTTERRFSPSRVLGGDWKQVVTGGASSCGIKGTGRLYCWGLNNYGQLGSTQSGPALKPRAVGTGSWKDVSAAWHHACGIASDSSMWCWGQNIRGSLGQGTTSRSSDKPRKVGTDSWKSVTAGGWHTCGIRQDGTGWCWGDNQLGQLGVGNDDRQTRPVRVGAASDRWLQLSTGYGHTCGIRADGRLLCWGLGDRGQLGNGSLAGSLRPTPVASSGTWLAVAVSDGGTCGVVGSGAVWCWGDNRYGQVAAASTAPVTRPVRRSSPSGASMISAGWLHTCAARADQVVTCWGSNEIGQASNTPTPSRRTTGGYDVSPGIESDPRVSPAEVVERAIGDRPRPSLEAERRSARAAGFTTRVMTFNVLGSNHTAPGGSRPDWAPGRVRAEWSDEIIRARNPDLIGLQESQPDQIGSFDLATGRRFTIYPGNTMGYGGATQSVMWRKDTWTVKWKSTVSIPFARERRPQPMVRLQHKGSGRQVYLVNTHLSAGTLEGERDRGTAILIRAIKELSKDGIPVLLTGDFNEHEEIYCKVLAQTDLVAAIGPSTQPGRCVPPRGLRVDQIFGSRGRFSGLRIDQGPMVQRTTDHSVSVVPFTVG